MDPNQPCLVLAGVQMGEDEAKNLLKHLPPTQADEYKAKNLLQSPRGRQGLLDILNDPLLNGSNCKVYLTDKPLMATMTLVDTFHYEMAYRTGYDMHKDGAAPAMSHLLHICTPAYIGRDGYYTMLRAFDRLSRKPSGETASEFYSAFLSFYEAVYAKDAKFAVGFWLPVIWGRDVVLDLVGKTTSGIGYDPAATSLMVGLHRWGDRFGGRFNVLCDESNTLSKYVDIIMALSSPNEPERVVGFGERKVRFPMRVNSFQFGKSESNSAIQLADLVAGTVKAALLGHLRYTAEPMPEIIKLIAEKDLIEDGLIPSKEAMMAPSGVITEPFGTNITEYSTGILKRQMP